MRTAVAIFGFNRKTHLERLIQSIVSCSDIDDLDFYIFLDGPRNDKDREKVDEVVSYIQNEALEVSFKEKFISDVNKGLANSIISGVSKLFNQGYDAVIVLEDDLVLSPYYFVFMKNCLKKYQQYSEIFSVSGYSYPPLKLKIPKKYPYDVFFSYRPHSWGWGTWKDKWEQAIWELDENTDVFIVPKARQRFNLGGDDLTNMLSLQLQKKINSWAIRWAYTHYKLNKYAIYPVISYVDNTGFDGSGTHCRNENFNPNQLSSAKATTELPDTIILDKTILKNFHDIFPSVKTFWGRAFLKKVYYKFFKPSSKST